MESLSEAPTRLCRLTTPIHSFPDVVNKRSRVMEALEQAQLISGLPWVFPSPRHSTLLGPTFSFPPPITDQSLIFFTVDLPEAVASLCGLPTHWKPHGSISEVDTILEQPQLSAATPKLNPIFKTEPCGLPCIRKPHNTVAILRRSTVKDMSLIGDMSREEGETCLRHKQPD